MINLFLEYQKRITRKIVWPYSFEEDSLITWRAYILSSILIACLVFGIPAFVSALILIIQKNAWGLAIIDMFGLIFCLVFLFVERIRFQVRATITLIICFIIGITVILSVGPLSGGPAWLFTFAVLSGVLLGNLAGISAIFLNIIALTIIGWLFQKGAIHPEFPFFDTPQNMITAGINFIVLNLITATSVSTLLKGLNNLFKKKDLLTEKLLAERFELIEVKKRLEKEIINRTNAHNALIESEAKYRSFIENAPMAMYTLNQKGEFTYGNKKLLSMTGYQIKDRLNKPFHPIVHPDDLHIAIEKFQKRLQGKADPEAYEIRVFHSSGKIIWVEIFSESLIEKDASGKEKIVGCQSFITDLTDRKNAESALRDSERKYRRLFELESDAILLVDDKSGKIIESNPAASNLYGYTNKEFAGLNISRLSAKLKDKKTDISDKLNPYKIVYHQKKDGTEILVEILSQKMTWNGYKTTIFAIRDITWRVKSDAERRRLEKELYHARKMESIGTLAGGIAHDFNNILQIMIGNSELAMLIIDKTHPVNENLMHIRESGLKGADIVKHLLNFSSQNELILKPVKAICQIKETLKFLRSTIPNNINIQTDLSTSEIIILANPVQFNQVLMNLFINASQAMENSGGTIEITAKEVNIQADHIELSSEVNPGKYLEIRISDNGPGIALGVIDKIFDPYFTTKEVGQGSGMGLAIVHGIVKSHNGFITVKSSLESGSTFKVYLPLTSQKPEQNQNQNKRQSVIETGRLLFVDDEELITQMAKESLEKFGYQVVTKLSPLEALKLFESSPDKFDLVITDMTMPEMRGDKLAAKLLRIRKDIPIIVCSGYNSSMDDQTAQNLGVKKYLMKPTTTSRLVKEIQMILSNKTE